MQSAQRLGARTPSSQARCQPTKAAPQPSSPSPIVGTRPAPTPLVVHFTVEDKRVAALSGEHLIDVASRAGVDISLGCNQGNCGICEVELQKFARKDSAGSSSAETYHRPTASGSPGDPASALGCVDKGEMHGSGVQVVRACLARLPPGYELVEVTQMTDQIWGVDGFDT
ncbi:hypothetical protein V8C86DRAFT_2873506 [Haematococcus lacustris]